MIHWGGGPFGLGSQFLIDGNTSLVTHYLNAIAWIVS